MKRFALCSLTALALAACQDSTEPEVGARVGPRPSPVVTAITTLASTLGPNLAPNPSFESGIGTQPDGWTLNPNGVPATFLWDVAFGLTGTSSLKISTSQGSPFVPLANPGWITSGFIPIEPGKEYQASVFTFTPDGGVGHIPAIQFFKADGTFLGTIGATGPSGITDPIGTWVKKTFRFVAFVPFATKIRFIVVQDIFTTKGALTTVFFDDVFFGLVTAVVEVTIDIKPGSDPNSINCNNEKESIAVAILTTDDFDATTVDHTTVAFEGASETHVDKKTGVARRHEEDVDGDGDTDLVFHFRLGETDLTCDSVEGTLEGETFDGQAIRGTDAVRMIDEGGGQA